MKPTIIIENEVYRKVMHWINKSHYEVSGLGLVKVEKDGVLRVTSAILLPQKNGATHTDIEPEDVNKALFQLRHEDGELKWWWHSHVQMGVFWSGTDHDTIKKIGEGGWVAATVFNQKNEIKSCYYGAHGQQTPWGTEALMLDDLDTKLSPLAIDDTTAWDQEYETNVTNSFQWTEADSYLTPQTMAAAKRLGISNVFDSTQRPPAEKPPGMSRKMHKRWQKKHAEWLSLGQANSFDMRTVPAIDAHGLDDYGFDQEERAVFAKEGWTLQDMDDLIEDFTPTELIRLARLSIKPSEVRYLLVQYNYSTEDIMGLAEQSESFGKNLFEGIENFGGPTHDA